MGIRFFSINILHDRIEKPFHYHIEILHLEPRVI